MDRRDRKVVADAVREEMKVLLRNGDDRAARALRGFVEHTLAPRLGEACAGFDAERFLNACGITPTQ